MKTEPEAAFRPANRPVRAIPAKAALILLLIVAAGLRLWHIDFGLPALNDPDEPLFVMTALDMLREHRLNPQWFGHPATILFYALAAIFALVGWVGTLLGHWSGAAGYVTAIYADPGIAILPMRLFIMMTAIGGIALTYRIGREALNPRTGLIAAALLACNPLHIELSQLIRTDMLASLFMLWSSLHAVRAARTGRLRHHIYMGMLLGLGGATKWPALLFLANAPGAILARWTGWRRALLLLPVATISAMIMLFIASPYLLFDSATVLRDLSGEARQAHPGATGGSMIHNLLWYGRHVVIDGFGPLGALLAPVGLALLVWRRRSMALVMLPGASLFLIGIAAQSLVWARWAVPLLPWIALCIATTIDMALRRLPARQARLAIAPLLALLLLPMLSSALSQGRMRADDSRQRASHWVQAHIPAQQSLLIEDAAFDLLRRPGPVLFPLGDAGCIDVHQFLKSKPSYRKVGERRTGKAIVDLGNVAPSKLAGCRADIAIITHYGRYRAEARHFPAQLQQYQLLLRGATLLARFDPVAGRTGGPETLVFRLSPVSAAPP